jgi:hypothetical protein
MPSRMLVALTPLTALGFTPASASRVHAQISSQFVAVSNTWEPGAPGSSRWVYSR